MIRRLQIISLLSSAVVSMALGGCKEDKPTCEPDSIEWGVSLVVGAGSRLNPNDDGEALPTAVRVFQLRGELAVEDLDAEAVWEAEKAEDLGESFLGFDELTVFPERGEVRSLPIEEDATHLLATGLFRQTLGNNWYTLYEIPRRHSEVVCAREPETKIFPDPCFFVYMDRSELSGGETPPPGYVPEGVDCAPLGPPPAPEPKRRRLRDRKKLEKDLDDPLRSKDIDKKTPKTPELPKSPQPELPSKPRTPQAPRGPDLPGR